MLSNLTIAQRWFALCISSAITGSLLYGELLELAILAYAIGLWLFLWGSKEKPHYGVFHNVFFYNLAAVAISLICVALGATLADNIENPHRRW